MMRSTLRAAAVTTAAVLLTLTQPLAAQNNQATFTVGTATAQRGTTATGMIDVPAGSDSGMSIPVAVVHGVKPGPVLALISGQHGTEYATIVAMQRLIPKLDAKKISGTVIILPVVNVESFITMTPARNPTDKKSMVGAWPGDPAGTQTARALAAVMKEVVNQANVIVDFHGGDIDEDIGIPFTAAVRGGHPKPDSESVRLAVAFGVKYIQIIDRDAASPRVGSRVDGQALLKDDPVILVGVGRSGEVTDNDIETVINGCLNVMGALKMIDRPAPKAYTPVWLNAASPGIPSHANGAFFETVPHGAMVKKGDVLGYTTDLVGNKTGDLVSPTDGIVVYMHGLPSMRCGVALAEVLSVFPSVPEWKAPAGRGGAAAGGAATAGAAGAGAAGGGAGRGGAAGAGAGAGAGRGGGRCG